MSDDKSKTGSPDRDRINVHEDYELRHWSKKFGVSAEQLKAAVTAVGPTAKAVEAHLKGDHLGLTDQYSTTSEAVELTSRCRYLIRAPRING